MMISLNILRALTYFNSAQRILPPSLATHPVALKRTGDPCIQVDGVWKITEDCVDPLYSRPIIDSETHETLPIPHLRASGHFDGTAVDFNIYPPESGWKGRFFQLVYPLQSSTVTDREIGFGADSGEYTVRASGLPTYRGDAAAAKVGMKIAREHYKFKNNKIYGYIYGGSGGSLITVGAMENTVGIWSGAAVMRMDPTYVGYFWNRQNSKLGDIFCKEMLDCETLITSVNV